MAPVPAVSWPQVPAWGSLEPSRRDGENAQKAGKNSEKMGEIRPKKCEGVGITWFASLSGNLLITNDVAAAQCIVPQGVRERGPAADGPEHDGSRAACDAAGVLREGPGGAALGDGAANRADFHEGRGAVTRIESVALLFMRLLLMAALSSRLLRLLCGP